MRIELHGKLDRVQADRLCAACAEGTQPLEIDISSQGGDAHAMIDAAAGMQNLQERGGVVTTRVQTYALSAAAVIFAAGDRRILHEGASLMLHPVFTPKTAGDRFALQNSADALTEFDSFIASVVGRAAGVDQAVAERWLSEETWFVVGGSEALLDATMLATHVEEATQTGERALAECFGLNPDLLPRELVEASWSARRAIGARALANHYRRQGLAQMQRRAARGNLPAEVRLALADRYRIGVRNPIPAEALYGPLWSAGAALVEE